MIDDFTSKWLITMDPPKHTHLRAKLIEGFKPNVIKAMAPKIQTIVDILLNDAQKKKK